jgi:SNF2 family DNA or RNA helicase
VIKTTLRDYQKEAVRRGLKYDGFGLFAEQRTGKCLISLAIADRRFTRKGLEIHRLLIVCPKNALNVWKQQIQQHWDYERIEIEIVNFEQVHLNRKRWQKFIRTADCSMMIVDEAHRLKSRSGKQSRACRTIGKYADYRMALTGTPITKPESFEDAWAIFNFLDPSILGRWASKYDRETGELIEEGFRDRYLKMGGFKGKKVIGFHKKYFQEFQEIFHKYSYRVLLRDVRQKSLIIHRVKHYVDMHSSNRKPYNELVETLKTTIQQKKIRIPQVMNLSIKLQQITGGFIFSTPKDPDQKAQVLTLKYQEKLFKLRCILPISKRTKILIVARFSHEIAAISDLIDYTGRTVKTIEGGVPYNGKFDTDVIVIQSGGGVAVDLSAAKIIIFYSWDFSYVNHEQMRFRVLSYDTKQVLYYYLMLRDSIDDLFYEAIVRKKKLATLVCDRYRRRN